MKKENNEKLCRHHIGYEILYEYVFFADPQEMLCASAPTASHLIPCI